MDRTLAAAHLASLAGHLQRYESLRVDAAGAVFLVRQFRAKTVGELEDACKDYKRGDHALVVRYQDYWLIEISRPLPQLIEA